MYALTDNKAYNNAWQYGMATAVGNSSRLALYKSNVGSSKKMADTFTGKSPASLSCWEWIKFGEISLKIYGKARALMDAIQSGTVTINAWRMMPKLAVFNENDPATPALMLGVVPASEGAIAIAKQLTDWSDPRYRLNSKADFSNIKGLVPSLAVKPSFFGAVAHYMKNDMTGQVVMARLHRNFHELMTSLSILQAGLAGGPEDPAKRFTVSSATEGAQVLMANDDSWLQLADEMTRSAAIWSPTEATALRQSMRGTFGNLQKLEQQNLKDAISRKSADTWAASALATEMDNMTLPLETDDYMTMVSQIETMVEGAASNKVMVGDRDGLLAKLRLEGADAAVNRLMRDEMRAIRQIYGMKARKELVDKMAPSIAQGLKNLREGAEKLGRLQNELDRIQAGQQAAKTVLGADKVKNLLKENFILD